MNPNNCASKRKMRLAIVVRGFDRCGSVAMSSLHQAEALANVYNVIILTDTGSAKSQKNR
jgi:hypothetical protein